MNHDTLGLVLGPALFFAVLLLLDGTTAMETGPRVVLALIAWMVVWWITSAVPLYATALLPLVVLPASNTLQIGSVAVNYADRVILLLLGSLMIARAVEVSGLHRRLALRILALLGSEGKSILGGFILVTAMLSAFMSNTVVAAMMIPLAISIISVMDEAHRRKIAPALMVTVAYSASIGGVITLVGTPPNLIFASMAGEMGYDVTFLAWLPVGLPVGSAMLLALWLYLLYMHRLKDIRLIGSREIVLDELRMMGRLSSRERAVLAVFLATVIAWVSRAAWGSYLPSIDDAVIALSAALSLFIIRVRDSGVADARDGKDQDEGCHARLLTWNDAAGIPWGVLILIGGSLAVADAFTSTGLDVMAASSIALDLDPSIMLLFITSLTIFLTELMSNTAVATLMLPVVMSLAEGMGVDPLGLMLAATLASSLSFMLPVATPPNAMAFASGYLTVAYMARVGFIMNLISIAVITLLLYILLLFIRF